MGGTLNPFPPATREDWERAAAAALKGRPLDSLAVVTRDGLRLAALEPRREPRPIPGRPAGAPWTVMARLDHPDPAAAARLARDDLAGGAGGLAVVLAGSPLACGAGLDVAEADGLEAALAGVDLGAIVVRLDGGSAGPELARWTSELAQRRGLHPSELRISFGLDPLGAAAVSGELPLPWPKDAGRAGLASRALRRLGFAGPFFAADGRVHHAAGASEAQELAAVLASALLYLRAEAESGVALGDAAEGLEFVLAADADEVMSLAKLRALRLLWAALRRDCGVDPAAPLRLHAETAWRMMTRHDPHTNLLRATIAAFAAGAGGADSLSVLPFTQAIGVPDGFARRIARNTQMILIEEANIHRVTDPGAGAGAIEAATEALCGAAWDLFCDIERHGGMAEALASGWWPGEVGRVRQARARDVATRAEPITGTSVFALGLEWPVEIAAPARPAAADGPLAPHRTAEPYERLREAADAAAAARGARPEVLLVPLGGPAEHGERLQAARLLFAAGGLEGVVADPGALAGTEARLACLCGTPSAYAGAGCAAAGTLAAAGATVWAIGPAAEAESALRAAGLACVADRGSDALALLAEAHRLLGIAGESA